MRSAGRPAGDEAVVQEAAWGDEVIDALERRADMQVAQLEVRQAALGEAAAARVGAGRVAQRAGAW